MSRAARAPPSVPVPVPVPAMRRAGDTHTRHVPPTHEGGGTCWHPLAPSRGTQPGHPAGDPHPTPRVGGHTHPDTVPALQPECPHVGTRGHPTMGWGWQLSPSLMPPPAPCLQLPCSSCAPPTPPKPPAQQLQPWRWRGGRHRTLLLPPVGCHPSRMSPSPGHHGMTSSPTPPPKHPPQLKHWQRVRRPWGGQRWGPAAEPGDRHWCPQGTGRGERAGGPWSGAGGGVRWRPRRGPLTWFSAGSRGMEAARPCPSMGR